ncbi:hypothetical protein ACFYKX_22545 [Cytobacillus sp. FJAT-54145]|uniref:C-type cytochrome biogenesis protein CcmI n=1 Tax=Cytobacillus spartinae TaxID=3299023 RepID=A0ABW6KHX5_9BACI
MDYIFLVIGSVIIITCFYFIIAPFFYGGGKLILSKEDEHTSSLEMIYATVNEIEMDFLMKKISKEDFEIMKKKYNLMAANLLKEEGDSIPNQEKKGKGSQKEIDIEIIKELEALRKQKGRK